MDQGKVVEVNAIPNGGRLTSAVTAGDVVFLVDDVIDYDENGGQIQVLEKVYTYTGLDSDNNIITGVNPPAVANYEVDELVLVYPTGYEKYATVDLADQEDAISARIPQTLISSFEDGIRELYDQETVLVDYTSDQEWVVADVIGREAKSVGYSVTDPEALPGVSDGLPPAYAPTIIANGTIRAAVITVEPISNPDLVQYEYHVKTDNTTPPTPGDPATAVHLGPETMVYIRTLADGSTVLTPETVPGTPSPLYYFWVFAKDQDGYGPISAEVSCSVKQVTGPDIAANAVDAININGKAVTAEKLAATIALLSAITVGANIRINPTEGIIIETPIGDTHFPPDGTDPSIAGNAQLQRATIADFLTILGLNSALAGTLTAEAGISNPKNKPAVVPSWSLAEHGVALSPPMPTGPGYGDPVINMQDFDATYWLVSVGNPSFLYGYASYWKVNKTTGAATAFPITGIPAAPFGAWGSNMYEPLSGFTKVGSNYHICASFQGGFSPGPAVIIVNSSGVYQGAYSGLDGWDLHYDGTNVLAAIPENGAAYGGGKCVINRSTGVPTVGSSVTPILVAKTNFDMNPVSLQGGPTALHDFGAVTRYVVLDQLTGNAEVIGTGNPATRYTANRFSSPGGETMRGVYYDTTYSGGARWIGSSSDVDQAAKIWGFAKNLVATSRSVKYIWERGIATIHKSMASPSETFNQAPRIPFKVTGDVIPQSTPLAADEPDRIRIFIDAQEQPQLPAGAISAYYREPTTGGAASPGSNGFAGLGAFGRFKSETVLPVGHPSAGSPNWDFSGDGSGRAGPYRWNAAGAPVEEAAITITGTSGTTLSTSSGTFIRHPLLGCETAFVAPASGAVLIETGFYLKDPTTLVLGCPELRTGATVGSGTIIRAAGVADAVGGQFNVSGPEGVMRYKTFIYVRGLTPGADYNTYLALYRTAAGLDVDNSYIRMTPMH